MAVSIELFIESQLQASQLLDLASAAIHGSVLPAVPGPYNPDFTTAENMPRLVFSGSRFFVTFKMLDAEWTREIESSIGLNAIFKLDFARLSQTQSRISTGEVARACRTLLDHPDIFGVVGYDTGENFIMKKADKRHYYAQSIPEEFFEVFSDYPAGEFIPGF